MDSKDKDEFLVILGGANSSVEPTFHPRGGDAGASIGIRQLDDYEAKALSDEDGVELVARAMPLRLIAPTIRSAELEQHEGDSTWGIKAIGADESKYDGAGIVVAVLDTGIDNDHECFRDIELEARDFTGSSSGDTDGHGTHCAGTIFGRNAGGRRLGVAPGISKALIGKVLGGKHGGSTTVLKKAIDWAIDEGAHVISLSLGIDFLAYVDRLIKSKDWPRDFATSVALEDYRSTIRFFDRFSDLIRSEVHAPLIVAAAGNASRRPQFPMDVEPPAAAERFLSVAAVEPHDGAYRVATFSNSNALCAAPGVDVLSAKAGGGYVSMSGTSMATPHVAGVAALWAQYLEQFDQDELWARLRGNARRFDLERIDVGAGVVQAPTIENT